MIVLKAYDFFDYLSDLLIIHLLIATLLIGDIVLHDSCFIFNDYFLSILFLTSLIGATAHGFDR